MNFTKTCPRCGETKPLDEFNNNKCSKDGKQSYCKECKKEEDKKYHQEHREEKNKQSMKYYKEHKKEINKQKKDWYEKVGRERQGKKSMYEDKSSAQWLGIVIGERLIRHLFKDVEIMPHGNPGFDFICNRGKKIDVKTACITLNHGKNPYWLFHIDHNKVAEYFILVAFDNRTDLNPIHLWMIPGKEINQKGSRSISLSTLHKWSQWEHDINDAQVCCTEMKNEERDKKRKNNNTKQENI